jgi:hypothetical protein
MVRVVRLDHQPIDVGTQLLGDARSISSEFDAAGLERAIAAEFGVEVANVTVTGSATDSAYSVPKHMEVELRATLDAEDLYRRITEIGALREFKFESSQVTDGIIITCLKCNHMPLPTFRTASDYRKHKCVVGAPRGGGRTEPAGFDEGGDGASASGAMPFLDPWLSSESKSTATSSITSDVLPSPSKSDGEASHVDATGDHIGEC